MVWGIGKRKFRHNCKRRVLMLDSLIKSMLERNCGNGRNGGGTE